MVRAVLDSVGNIRASGEFLFQKKGNIDASAFGSKPVCALGNEQHGSNLSEQRRALKARAYSVRRQAAECGDNPVLNGLAGIGGRDESLEYLIRSNDAESFGSRRCAARVAGD